MVLSLPETITMNQWGHQAWWDMFWAVGALGMFTESQAGCIPATHTYRGKETVLKEHFLFVSIVWFFIWTVYSDEPWWIEHKFH